MVFHKGQRILLYEKSPDEIWENDSPENLYPRLYVVDGISIQRQKQKSGKIDNYGVLILRIHNSTGKKSLNNNVIEDIKIVNQPFRLTDHTPRLKLLHGQVNALVEGIDFVLSYDGKLEQL
jgi:CRISPR-associated endonuclease Csn1